MHMKVLFFIMSLLQNYPVVSLVMLFASKNNQFHAGNYIKHIYTTKEFLNRKSQDKNKKGAPKSLH